MKNVVAKLWDRNKNSIIPFFQVFRAIIFLHEGVDIARQCDKIVERSNKGVTK